MSDEIDIDKDDRLAERRNRQTGNGKGGNKLITFGFLALILVASPFIILGPDGVGKFLGLATSDSEELQQASRADNGISTQLPAPNVAPDTSVPDIEVPDVKPVERALNEAEKKRIAELEAQLLKLQNQPKEQSITPEQVAALLGAQMATLRDEAARAQEARDEALRQQIAALRSSLAPKGPSAEELAEQERLRRQAELDELERQRKLRLEEEERQRKLAETADEKRKREEAEAAARQRAEDRRQKAEELRLKQLESESVLFDGTEEGETAPGSTDANNSNANVRELSSNEQFLQSASTSGFETARANNLGDLSRIIVQGTIISAALETAINTELPGNIRAQVTEPVFSYDGEEILMPAGTRLIGTFNSDINTAQKRVLIAWNRAITPNGDSVELGSTGTDRLGRSGTRGNVDSRFIQRFGSAILITAISALPSFLSTESENSSIEAANDVANQASSDLSDQTESALEDRLNLPPIIRVPQGQEIRVFVNRDLVF